MNIKDFDKDKLYTWDEIFELQKNINCEFNTVTKESIDDFDISYYKDQELFKRYCWYITEELTEAVEAERLKEDTHLKEELIDALNFTIGLYSLYGWKIEDLKHSHIKKQTYKLDSAIFETMVAIGLTANCLKNREWRESQYLVDLVVFEERLKYIWGCFMEAFRHLHMYDKDIRELWGLKYQVNRFRIESKY